MPQVQIISRQEDPEAKLLAQAGNDIADTFHKVQSLKLTGQYYKILAKNAQTEQDKFKFERLAKLNSDILPQIASTKDPATKQMLIKGVVDSGAYDGDANTLFHDIADSHQISQDHFQAVKGQLSNMAPPEGGYASEGQLRSGQLQNQLAETAMRIPQAANALAMANVMRQQLGQPLIDENGQPSQTPTDSAPATATPAAADSGQPQAPGLTPIRHQLVMSGISGGQPQFTDIGVDAAKAGATSRATDVAKRDLNQISLSRAFDDFMTIDNTIQRSSGGIIDRLKTGAATQIKGMAQDTPEGQAIAAYDALKKRLRVNLARQVDVGNLSASEQQAAEKAIPSLYDSQGTRQIKVAFLKDLMRTLDSNEPSHVKELFTQYQQRQADLKNPNSPRAQAVAQLDAQTKTNQSGQSGFTEGKVYVDAKGNKARYVNGQFQEMK